MLHTVFDRSERSELPGKGRLPALRKSPTNLTNSAYTWISLFYLRGAGFLHASGLAAFLFLPSTHLLKRCLGSEAEIRDEG